MRKHNIIRKHLQNAVVILLLMSISFMVVAFALFLNINQIVKITDVPILQGFVLANVIVLALAVILYPIIGLVHLAQCVKCIKKETKRHVKVWLLLNFLSYVLDILLVIKLPDILKIKM